MGTRCELTGDIETRKPGPRVVRFCESHETGLADKLRRGSLGDYELASVYRYDGTSGYDRI